MSFSTYFYNPGKSLLPRYVERSTVHQPALPLTFLCVPTPRRVNRFVYPHLYVWLPGVTCLGSVRPFRRVPVLKTVFYLQITRKLYETCVRVHTRARISWDYIRIWFWPDTHGNLTQFCILSESNICWGSILYTWGANVIYQFVWAAPRSADPLRERAECFEIARKMMPLGNELQTGKGETNGYKLLTVACHAFALFSVKRWCFVEKSFFQISY